jgi:hypothetical protein
VSIGLLEGLVLVMTNGATFYTHGEGNKSNYQANYSLILNAVETESTLQAFPGAKSLN